LNFQDQALVIYLQDVLRVSSYLVDPSFFDKKFIYFSHWKERKSKGIDQLAAAND